jgi:hypothetical protein
VVINWTYGRVDPDQRTLTYRLDKLVRSITGERVIADVNLETGRNDIPHGGLVQYVRPVLRGATPTIGISIGDITPTHVAVYVTAACTADLFIQ